jgi:hypothetical protein
MLPLGGSCMHAMLSSRGEGGGEWSIAIRLLRVPVAAARGAYCSREGADNGLPRVAVAVGRVPVAAACPPPAHTLHRHLLDTSAEGPA